MHSIADLREAASKPNSSQPGDKSRKVVNLSRVLKPGTDLKLPILAKHGNTTLLRFSELFTDPIKPERYESRRVRRRIADGSSPYLHGSARSDHILKACLGSVMSDLKIVAFGTLPASRP